MSASHPTPQLDRLSQACQRLRLHRVDTDLCTLLEQAAKRELGYADFLDEVLGLELAAKQSKHLAMRIRNASAWPAFPFKVAAGL